MSFSASGGRWVDGTSISYQRGPIGVISTRRGSRSACSSWWAQRPDDPDLEPRLGQPLGDPLAPLDDRDGVVERGVEVEVVELVDAAEPVGVDVHQRAGRRPSDGCTRAITNVGEVTSPRTPSPAPSPWVNVVLPAPSSPLSTTRSPARSWPASERPELAHRVGVGHVEQERAQRPAQLDVRRVPPDLAEPLPLPEPPRLGQLLAGDARSGRRTRAAASTAALDQQPRRCRGPARVGDHAEPAQVHRRARPGRAPARRPARRRGVASSPPCSPSQSAIDSSVSVSAAAGGSSGGRDLERRPDHGEHVGGAPRGRRGVRRRSPGRRLGSAAAASSWSSAALTWSCRSRITMWPAPSHSSSVEPAMRACSLRLWPIEVSLSSVPQMTEVGTSAEGVDGVELVERPEVREELRDHLERRRRRASRRRTRRSSPARRRRTRTRRSRPMATSGPAGAGRRRSGARAPAWRRRRGASRPPSAGGSIGQQDPVRRRARRRWSRSGRRRRPGRRTARGAARPAR